MAYLGNLSIPCDRGSCYAQATQGVYDKDGFLVGRFCVAHAQQRVKQVAVDEANAHCPAY